jgi:DNA-binding transcriptional LysR family regulator
MEGSSHAVAANILAEGEAAEDAAVAQATTPRAPVRLAAPMSFGLRVAPLLPEFLAKFPEVPIDLHLSDAMVDLIGEGFDAAIRIAADPSLVARRLCEMPRYLVCSPAYFKKHGRLRHPLHFAQYRCLRLCDDRQTWRFTKDRKSATVRLSSQVRVNNGDAMMPASIAGTGLGILPEFILHDARAAGRLEKVLPDWSVPPGAVYWVIRPADRDRSGLKPSGFSYSRSCPAGRAE